MSASSTRSVPSSPAEALFRVPPEVGGARRWHVRAAAVLALAAGGAAVAAIAPALATGWRVLTIEAVFASLLFAMGIALALVQGGTSSDRRGRRRFTIGGLLTAAVGIAVSLLGFAPIGALLVGIGAAVIALTGPPWLADTRAPSTAAVTGSIVATIGGLAVGALLPDYVAGALVLLALLTAALAPETVVSPQTPIYVLPALSVLSGRFGSARVLIILAIGGLALWLPLLAFAGAVVVVILLVLLARTASRRPVVSPTRIKFSARGSRGYRKATSGFDLGVKFTPLRAATVGTVEQVQDAVTQAAAEGLGVRMHSTGHAKPTSSDMTGELLLRVRMQGEITVDADRRLVRVPAGKRWADVVGALRPYGLTVPHGSASTVGVVGYLIRGGLSAYGRSVGVAANSLESIELVTADGRLVVASRENEPDLFWALRGGGGGLGVITAVTVRAFDPGHVVTGTTAWELTDAAGIADSWAEWSASAPDAITTTLRVVGVIPIPGMPVRLAGRPLLFVDGTAVDRGILAVDAAGDLLRRLRGVARPVLDTWREVDTAEVAHTHMDPPFSPPHASDTALFGDLAGRSTDRSRQIVGAFVEEAARRKTPLALAELRQLGGRLAEPAEDGGAVSHLAGEFAWFGIAIQGPGRSADGARAALASVAGPLAPWSTGYTVPTFVAERELPQRSFDADTAQAVDRVRAAVDPTGMFRGDIAAAAIVEPA